MPVFSDAEEALNMLYEAMNNEDLPMMSKLIKIKLITIIKSGLCMITYGFTLTTDKEDKVEMGNDSTLPSSQAPLFEDHMTLQQDDECFPPLPPPLPPLDVLNCRKLNVPSGSSGFPIQAPHAPISE